MPTLKIYPNNTGFYLNSYPYPMHLKRSVQSLRICATRGDAISIEPELVRLCYEKAISQSPDEVRREEDTGRYILRIEMRGQTDVSHSC